MTEEKYTDNYIRLVWADKFRELAKDQRLTPAEIIVHFFLYIKEMEDKLNIAIAKQHATDESNHHKRSGLTIK